MSLNHAYLVKGWLLGELTPDAVMTAIDAVIESLTRAPIEREEIRGPDVTAAVLELVVAPEPGPSGTQPHEQGTDGPPPDPAAEPDESERKKGAWSPEARAAAVEDEKSGRGWALWQKEKLLEMKAAGRKSAEIGAELGKTASQVNQMYHHLKNHGRDQRDTPAPSSSPGEATALS